MKTSTLTILRSGVLALAAVMAWGSAPAQDSPGASKGFDNYGRRNGMADHDDYQRYNDRRHYSRHERAERDRAERRRAERERQRAERERRRHQRWDGDAARRGYGVDGETRRRGGEIHPGGG